MCVCVSACCTLVAKSSTSLYDVDEDLGIVVLNTWLVRIKIENGNTGCERCKLVLKTAQAPEASGSYRF